MSSEEPSTPAEPMEVPKPPPPPVQPASWFFTRAPGALLGAMLTLGAYYVFDIHGIGPRTLVAFGGFGAGHLAMYMLRRSVGVGEEVWKKLTMLSVLLAAAGGIVALVLTSFGDATVYSKGVDQLLSEKSRWVGRNVRVEGTLVKGTLVFREKPCEYRFDVTRASALLHVRYPSCTKPDTLRDDMPEVGVTAEGKLQPEGDFLATNVLAKCPSKYEMKEKAKNGQMPPDYVPPTQQSGLPGGPPASLP
jgi:cytochrome c-type biogenesis protein CcmE